MVLASISNAITQWIADNGVYAVFALMALDALLPVGGELVMLFAGVLASGSVAGHHVTLLGASVASGVEGYIVLSLAGTLGYLLGALVGWAVGRSGGRVLVERHGHRVHVGPETLSRAERWFERFGLGAVLLGRITPVVRSFISIPAGVFRAPLAAYTMLSLIGSAIWCFAFAGAGWALGGSWHRFHRSFGYVDIIAVAVVCGVVALLVLRRVRTRARSRESSPSAGGDRTDAGSQLPE